MESLDRLLLDSGIANDTVRSLGRWDKVGRVRDLADDHERNPHLAKYQRAQKKNQLMINDAYHDQCDAVFEAQTLSLSKSAPVTESITQRPFSSTIDRLFARYGQQERNMRLNIDENEALLNYERRREDNDELFSSTPNWSTTSYTPSSFPPPISHSPLSPQQPPIPAGEQGRRPQILKTIECEVNQNGFVFCRVRYNKKPEVINEFKRKSEELKKSTSLKDTYRFHHPRVSKVPNRSAVSSSRSKADRLHRLPRKNLTEPQSQLSRLLLSIVEEVEKDPRSRHFKRIPEVNATWGDEYRRRISHVIDLYRIKDGIRNGDRSEVVLSNFELLERNTIQYNGENADLSRNMRELKILFLRFLSMKQVDIERIEKLC